LLTRVDACEDRRVASEAEYAQASDPSTPLERLAELAYHYPELRPVVAGNPSAYDDLLTWLGTIGDPATDAVLAGRRGESIPPVVLDDGAQDSDDLEPEPSVERPVRRRLLIISAAVLAVVVVVGGSIGIGSAVAQQARESARAEFQSMTSSLASLGDEIDAAREEAETLLAATPATAVADPETLAGLTRAIEQAGDVDSDAPQMAQTTSGIEAQNSELAGRVDELDETLWALYDATAAVHASERDLLVQRVTPSATHSFVAQDANGNRQRITITIGSWVRGQDAALLDEAWQSIGGEGPMPLSTTSGFTMEDGAIVFGTVSIENLTPDFSAANFAGGQSWVYLSPLVPFDGWFVDWQSPTNQGMGAVLQSRQYSTGVSTDAVGGGDPLIRAAMEGDRWGAAPFVIGIDTVFTPEHPAGNALIDDVRFGLSVSIFADIVEGEQSFAIGRTW
jgi:hypothetical protein